MVQELPQGIKRTINFNQIVHNYNGVPIYIIKSCVLGLCVPHTCLAGLGPMQQHTFVYIQHVMFAGAPLTAFTPLGPDFVGQAHMVSPLWHYH